MPEHRANRRALRIAAAAALLSLLAAACGDDDDGAATDGDAPTTAAPSADGGAEASGTPIRIGAIVDETGPQSIDSGSSRQVSEAWAEHVNADGGIAGHPVEIVFEDTAGDPAAGTAAVEEFVGDETIAGVFIVDAAGEAAFGPALSEAALPVVGGVGYNPTLWGALPYFYNATTSFPDVVASSPVSAQELGVDTVAGAPCAEVPACRGSEQFFNTFAEGLGLENAGQIEISGSNVDYNAECIQFIDEGAGLIQLSVTNATAVRLAEDCVAQGYDGYFGVTATTVTADLYGEDIRLAGGLNAFPWYADAPAVEDYRTVMQEAGLEDAAWGNTAATGVYASLELFRTAISANEDLLADDALSREDVIEAYATVADEDLDGLLSQPLTFDESGISPRNTCFWLYTAEGGEISGDFEPVCLADFGLDS